METPMPKVGDLATMAVGSDRYPYTVIAVSLHKHVVTLQSRAYHRLDDRGAFTEDQEYETMENLDGSIEKATLRKNGAYRIMCGMCPVYFGHATVHRDPHF